MTYDLRKSGAAGSVEVDGAVRALLLRDVVLLVVELVRGVHGNERMQELSGIISFRLKR